MKKNLIIYILLVMFVFTGNLALAAGLQTGNSVRAMKKNELIAGRIIAINVEKDLFSIILPSGTILRVDFKNIRKIEDTGEKKKITPSYSSTTSNHKIYRFTFVDGKTVEGAVATWPIFDIDTGTTGIQKNIWLHYLEYIRAIE